MFWKTSSLKQASAIPERQILKSMQKERWIALTMKWNSGFPLSNKGKSLEREDG